MFRTPLTGCDTCNFFFHPYSPVNRAGTHQLCAHRLRLWELRGGLSTCRLSLPAAREVSALHPCAPNPPLQLWLLSVASFDPASLPLCVAQFVNESCFSWMMNATSAECAYYPNYVKDATKPVFGVQYCNAEKVGPAWAA